LPCLPAMAATRAAADGVSSTSLMADKIGAAAASDNVSGFEDQS